MHFSKEHVLKFDSKLDKKSDMTQLPNVREMNAKIDYSKGNFYRILLQIRPANEV